MRGNARVEAQRQETSGTTALITEVSAARRRGTCVGRSAGLFKQARREGIQGAAKRILGGRLSESFDLWWPRACAVSATCVHQRRHASQMGCGKGTQALWAVVKLRGEKVGRMRFKRYQSTPAQQDKKMLRSDLEPA